MAMNAAACAARIANKVGCDDAQTKTQMIELWTKMLTEIFAEVCNAEITTNAGQTVAVTVATPSGAGSGGGSVTSNGTANIVG